MSKTVLITGSSGLIGSQCVSFFCEKGYNVVGVDNNMRAYFFGEEASTLEVKTTLEKKYSNYKCYNIDIRNKGELGIRLNKLDIEIIIHTAAQPSHDWASKEPLTDFEVNALGTMNLLEFCRNTCPDATFIFTSTNKVYGDRPNSLNIEELETRYECYEKKSRKLFSIDESMSIDACKHSIFGASKVAADIMVQEYGRYFGLNTVVFRGGCLTGPNHKGAELHGFLSYLVKCIVNNKPYTVFGYKGKQVRDNIHSSDLVNMFWEFHKSPRAGEVYNAGGGRDNSTSILEAVKKIENFSGEKGCIHISENNREGDHIWYITDFSKFQNHYPNWHIEHSLDSLLEEMVRSEKQK